jgi:hypothetical protein
VPGAKQLERGRFVWPTPSASGGVISISASQAACLRAGWHRLEKSATDLSDTLRRLSLSKPEVSMSRKGMSGRTYG